MRSTRLVEEREVAGATLDAPRSANPAAEGQHLPVVTAVGDEVDRPFADAEAVAHLTCASRDGCASANRPRGVV
jgi:hypothetical protein